MGAENLKTVQIMLTLLILALAAIIAALSVAAGILLYVYLKLCQTTQDEDGPEDMDNETEDAL